MQIGQRTKFSSAPNEDLICWNFQWLLPRHSSRSELSPSQAGSPFRHEESYLHPWKSCFAWLSDSVFPQSFPQSSLCSCYMSASYGVSFLPVPSGFCEHPPCSALSLLFSSPSYLYRNLSAKIIQLIIHSDSFLDLLILSRPLLSCPNEYLSLSLWHLFTGADPAVQDQYSKN